MSSLDAAENAVALAANGIRDAATWRRKDREAGKPPPNPAEFTIEKIRAILREAFTRVMPMEEAYRVSTFEPAVAYLSNEINKEFEFYATYYGVYKPEPTTTGPPETPASEVTPASSPDTPAPTSLDPVPAPAPAPAAFTVDTTMPPKNRPSQKQRQSQAKQKEREKERAEVKAIPEKSESTTTVYAVRKRAERTDSALAASRQAEVMQVDNPFFRGGGGGPPNAAGARGITDNGRDESKPWKQRSNVGAYTGAPRPKYPTVFRPYGSNTRQRVVGDRSGVTRMHTMGYAKGIVESLPTSSLFPSTHCSLGQSGAPAVMAHVPACRTGSTHVLFSFR